MKQSELSVVSCLICNPKSLFVDLNCWPKEQLLYRGVGLLFFGAHVS